MKVAGTVSSTFVQEQKRAFAETGRFADILEELKCVKREGNQVKLDPTKLVGNEQDECAEHEHATYKFTENGLPAGMVKWEDMGHHTAPVQPELSGGQP